MPKGGVHAGLEEGVLQLPDSQACTSLRSGVERRTDVDAS